MPEPEDFSPEWQAKHERTKIRHRAAAVFHLLMAIYTCCTWDGVKLPIFAESDKTVKTAKVQASDKTANTTVDYPAF